MCLSHPSIPQDNSAQTGQQIAQQQQQDAQQRADTRQAAITDGQSKIDSAFSSFDKPYYDKYATAYEDNYNPQVDEQYSRAKQGEQYNYARAGVLDSTPAIHGADLLNESYGNARQTVASNAVGATDALKNNVATQKASLYSQNTAAADPEAAATNASAAVDTMPSRPQYSQLGDLFSGLVNAGAGYVKGQYATLPPGYQQQFAPGAGLPGAGGSGRVVS
jgi:hypothetical protein